MVGCDLQNEWESHTAAHGFYKALNDDEVSDTRGLQTDILYSEITKLILGRKGD